MPSRSRTAQKCMPLPSATMIAVSRSRVDTAILAGTASQHPCRCGWQYCSGVEATALTIVHALGTGIQIMTAETARTVRRRAARCMRHSDSAYQRHIECQWCIVEEAARCAVLPAITSIRSAHRGARHDQERRLKVSIWDPRAPVGREVYSDMTIIPR